MIMASSCIQRFAHFVSYNCFSFLSTGDFEFKLDDVCDSRRDDVSRDDWADATGSSGENDVAGLQREVLGDGGDESGNVEDHVTSRGSLALLRVHFQPQFHVVRIGNRRLGMTERKSQLIPCQELFRCPNVGNRFTKNYVGHFL